MGAALALLLVGGSLVLAGQALDLGGPNAPVPSARGPAVPPAPELLVPEETLLASATVDLEVNLPGNLAPRAEFRLRIYVNEQLVRERRLPDETVAQVREVPLEQGENRITAAISGQAGESLHSAALELVRDDVAPVIRVTSPDPARSVFAERVALRGRTEPGASLIVRNSTSGEEYETAADTNGRWEVRLRLAMGRNVISLRSLDEAGNRSRATVPLERVDSRAAISLEIQPSELSVDQLPASIRMVARVHGLRGEPLDGAPVTFSLSVPGQQTLTYNTTSRNGVASWSGIRIPRDGAREGHGLATVMALLDDGQGDQASLQESASIRFR